jgi:competence protein ComEA
MSPATSLTGTPEPHNTAPAAATATPREAPSGNGLPPETEPPLPFQPETDLTEANRTGGLTRGDCRFLLVTGALLLVLSAAHWALLSGFGLREVEIDRLPERQFDFRVDVNRATWVEWMQLENIGETTARKIVADREQRGPFRSIEDVARVPGIGPKTLARIRPYLSCSDCPSADDSERSSLSGGRP